MIIYGPCKQGSRLVLNPSLSRTLENDWESREKKFKLKLGPVCRHVSSCRATRRSAKMYKTSLRETKLWDERATPSKLVHVARVGGGRD